MRDTRWPDRPVSAEHTDDLDFAEQPARAPEALPASDSGGDSLSLISHYFRDAAHHSLLGERAERRLSTRLNRALRVLETHRQLPPGTPRTLRDVLDGHSEADFRSPHARRAVRLALACRRTLIESNLRLAVHLARRHANRGIPLTDLIQDGNIGLIKAVERFAPDKGFRFSTYAYWWISEEIRRSLKRGRRIVRTPEQVVDEIRALQAATHKLQQASGQAPSARELASHLDTTPERVEELRGLSVPEVSTETPLSDSEDIRLGDALASEAHHTQPDLALVPRDQQRLMDDILSNLTDRERDILCRRFGLGLPEPETLQSISEHLGISRERVRQIEKGALAKLRSQYANLASLAGN
ncbi:sigma-70 family RNA polymerase sigma factor [Marinobacter mangrovi]|uniref:sigma-70 family RNA polymerase sigma factor n=1 Tax=Marinobacter mangrovi TaxID=2803918 RepID=UPI0019348853|nr:RNA polymerase sigma factor RpoD/SigA [Marinobacter mangrovi]